MSYLMAFLDGRHGPSSILCHTATRVRVRGRWIPPGLKSGLKSIDVSKNTTRSSGNQSSQSKPPSEGADLPTANVPGADADRPRANTKRAVLIGMLERPDGASVAELGQRLGWLPHTVRAAITGLRHAGREVTRSKDAEGQSVYRLARPETVGR